MGVFWLGGYINFLACKWRHSEHWSEEFTHAYWKIMFTVLDQLPIKHPAPRGEQAGVVITH
jgi:hypothetical protein